jgi:hypothetical protein
MLLSFSVIFVVAAQEDKPKPQMSKEALTPEQIAVYRAVLNDYMREGEGSLNISIRTEPAELADDSSDSVRAKEIGFKAEVRSVRVVHKLDSVVRTDRRYRLVDPEEQAKKVDENDPQKLIKRAIDDREKVAATQVDDSVKQAFSTALFSLTEIIFDKSHRQAFVAYSFWCGSLCGNGSTMILKKTGQKWKVSKVCGSWVS